MPPLTRIRAERERMSAIERRIADFVCDNAHLLRDYSSQQLAHALGISQSSVVKFSQKLGYRGYPDLKYSIGQAVALAGDLPTRPGEPLQADGSTDITSLLDELAARKRDADQQTRLLNRQQDMEHIVALLDRAPRVFVHGLGDDGVYARELTIRLSLLGMLAIHQSDPILMLSNLSAVRDGDVLLMLSEFGKMPALIHISRQFQDLGGSVVSVTRHTANPLRAMSDASLVVCAHDQAPHMAQLLYRSALQSLLDCLFVLLCHANPDRLRLLGNNLERVQHLIDT